MEFAADQDHSGDGRTDILCVEPNGRITARLWRENGFISAGQVKATEGWDRANIRFADVEGSGRADLIHLNKYTGAATVFKNDGYRPGDEAQNKGSTFHWTNRGVLYSPIDRGENTVCAACSQARRSTATATTTEHS